jgi:hypothetical protein
MPLFYLMIVEELPSGESRFLGGLHLLAEDEEEAAVKAIDYFAPVMAEGAKAEAEICELTAAEAALVPEKWCNRLLNWQELDEFDIEMDGRS